MLSRRELLSALVALSAVPALAGPLRRQRRRVRRRVRRRRIRRHVLWRMVGHRRLLVVPVAVAVGWELLVDEHVALVQAVHVHDIVVKGEDGKTQKLDVQKEDNADNAKELEGSEYEVEEEVEESAAH